MTTMQAQGRIRTTGPERQRGPSSLTLRAGIYCFLAGMISVAVAQVDPLEQVAKKGETLGRARLDRAEIELAGSVLLTLTIDGRGPLDIEPIPTITRSPEWRLMEQGKPQTTQLELGRTRWQQSYRLEPMLAKDVALPLESVRVRSRDGETVVLEWQPFTVKVRTVVPGVALGAIKDIVLPEQVPVPEQFPWEQAGVGVAGGLGLMLLAWVAWRRRNRPSAPVAELPAGEWALRELTALANAVPTAGQGERWHMQLAEVLRQYVGRRFGVHTAELTTGELLAALDQRKGVTAAHLDMLRVILEQCDLAKFARIDWTTPECQSVVQQAKAFVEQTVTAAAAAQPVPSEQPLPTA